MKIANALALMLAKLTNNANAKLDTANEDKTSANLANRLSFEKVL